jgi:hypothetical protein
MESIWKVWCDSKHLNDACLLLHRMKMQLQAETIDESIKPCHKGGHVVCFSVKHQTSNWSEFVVQVLEFGQRVAYEWMLTGDVRTQLDGWSNKARVSGIQSVQWICDVQYQAKKTGYP